MTPQERKNRYRLFWIIKGHLDASEETIFASYDGYFKRVWYNEESWVHEEGFEEAYHEIFPNLGIDK